MKVRHPTFDFSGMTARWTPHREFAHHFNSVGIIPSAIEPFLIKVMRRAKAELDPVADAALIADIDIFNRQEGQHYKTHDAFNKMVADDGYPELLDYDNRLKDEYTEMLRTKSIEWLLGYCEAFESLAASGAHIWVDGVWGDYLDGADPRVVELWRWHLAEEYEHRTVVHRTYHRLCAGTAEEVYAKRIELFNFCTTHMFSHTTALRTYLLGVDRATMSETEWADCERRVAEVDARNAANQAGVAAVLEPTWDPASLPPPRGVEAVLGMYS